MNDISQNKLLWAGLMVIFLILFVTIFSERGLIKAHHLSLQRDEVRTKSIILQAENSRLSQKRDALKTDMQTIEKTARKDLDLIRKDEILYKFVD